MPNIKKNRFTKTEALKRLEARNTRRRFGRLILVTLGLSVVLAGVAYLFYCPQLSITSIAVQGNELISSAEVSGFVDQALSGKLWRLLPRRSELVYPKREIELKLTAAFPRLATATLDLTGDGVLTVSVRENEADTIWCGPVASSTPTQRQCFFADRRGLIYAPAPDFSPGVFVELAGLLPVSPLGAKPLLSDDYQNLALFAKNLPALFVQAGLTNERLIRVDILTSNDFSAVIADLGSRAGDNFWTVRFNLDRPPEKLAGDLLAVLSSAPFKRDRAAAPGRLQTIDLRYGPKVFYKFKP